MKNVLITGASHGVGEALAKKYAKEGYNLALCCRKDIDKLENLAETLHDEYGTTAITFQVDVSDTDMVREMVSAAIRGLGGIDILINNAGVSYVGLLTDMTRADWDEVIGTNLNGVFGTCRSAVPHMVEKKNGRIINVSSVWGNVGASCEVAYSASKGAVNIFSKALAKELAPSKIAVNAIALGCVDTRMNACFSEEDKAALCDEIPAGRFATPEEVADFIFSISQTSEYLTGQVITFDGGWQ